MLSREEFDECINLLENIYITFCIDEDAKETWYEELKKREITGLKAMVLDFAGKSELPPQSPTHLINVAFNRYCVDDLGPVFMALTSMQAKILIEALESLEKSGTFSGNKLNAIKEIKLSLNDAILGINTIEING